MRKYIFLAGTLALLLAGCGTSAPEQTEALTSIAAYPETMHLTVGSHEGIQVVLTPSDASEQELVWASSNKAVATVDEAGIGLRSVPGNLHGDGCIQSIQHGLLPCGSHCGGGWHL